MGDVLKIIGDAEQTVGAPLFATLVSAVAGVELSDKAPAQEAEAVRMVQRMLGFATALPFVTTKIKSALEAILGEHAPEALLKSIEEIPNEIGINFFIGTVLERIFETAVSRPFEEAIAEQKRPARLEWPQLRALARQHAISDSELRDRLAKAGFRDSDIELISTIDRQLLTLSDIQQAYLYGVLDDNAVSAKLGELGFNPEDSATIRNIYLTRADTAGGNQLRAVAQQAYLNGTIAESQYREYLREANVPPLSIDLEVQAIQLAKQTGRRLLSVADIKRQHSDGILDDAQARSRLVRYGYNDDDASSIVQDWNVTKTTARSGFSESRILSYLVSGVLTPTQAYDRLVRDGIRPEDASFLIAHPETVPRVRAHPLEPGTIIAAYKDGLLTQPEAESGLRAANVDQAQADLLVRKANYELNRGPKTRQGPKRLSEAQIIEAMKYGLATAGWAARELESEGYSQQDAELIVAIEETRENQAVPPGWTVLD